MRENVSKSMMHIYSIHSFILVHSCTKLEVSDDTLFRKEKEDGERRERERSMSSWLCILVQLMMIMMIEQRKCTLCIVDARN